MTKEEALREVQKSFSFLKDYPEWNSNIEVVMAAVKNHGWNLQYASDELKKIKKQYLLQLKTSS